MTVTLNPEICYFLGMITGRGRIFDDGTNKRIIIELAHKNPLQTGIPFCPHCNGVVTNSKCKSCGKKTQPKYNIQIPQRKEILKTIQNVISPLIKKLVGKPPDVTGSNVYTYISIDFSKNKNLFDFIKNQFKPYNSFHKFEIPKSIYSISKDLKLEYISGISDTAGFPVWGNWHQSGLTRMYIQIINSNWRLPVQICNFLQDELGIPIQTIDWGHPNIRDGNMTEYKKGKESASFREHQIKIFSENFEKVSLKFQHKKKLLDEMIRYNKSLGITNNNFCEPPKPISDDDFRIIHDAENSDKLPQELKGEHFDKFWQVCWKMGCNRCNKNNNNPNVDSIFLTGRNDINNFSAEKKKIDGLRSQKLKILKSSWGKPKPKKKIASSQSSGLTEEDTYEPQRAWLEEFLKTKYPGSTVATFVVADTDMSSFFRKAGLEDYSELVEDFDIRPDVVGFVDGGKIAFIESKITLLGIKEIGQLLGYCLVADPEIAILCSTKDSEGNLTTILQHEEIVKFGKNKIIFATWDHDNKKMKFFGENSG